MRTIAFLLLLLVPVVGAACSDDDGGDAFCDAVEEQGDPEAFLDPDDPDERREAANVVDELAGSADEDLQPFLEVVAQVFRTDTVVEPGSSEREAFDRVHEAVEDCTGEATSAGGPTTTAGTASTDPEVVAFCERLVELDEAGQGEQVDTTDLEDLDRLYDQLDEVARIAPEEVADDLRLIADGQRFLATGLGEGEQLPPSIEDLDDTELTDALNEAYGHVREYLAAECAISAAPN